MFSSTVLILALPLSLFIAIFTFVFLSLRATEDVRSTTSNIVISLVVFLFIFIPAYNITKSIERHHKASAKVEDKQEYRENKLVELKDKSENWMNSYDDKKFSTYELYLLKEVQKQTKVKVYDKSILLQDTKSKVSQKEFYSAILNAKAKLDKN